MANFQSESGRKPIRNQLFCSLIPVHRLEGSLASLRLLLRLEVHSELVPRPESLSVSTKTNTERITMTEFALNVKLHFLLHIRYPTLDFYFGECLTCSHKFDCSDSMCRILWAAMKRIILLLNHRSFPNTDENVSDIVNFSSEHFSAVLNTIECIQVGTHVL